MTTTCELRMPDYYVQMDDDEMEYVEGGTVTYYGGYLKASECGSLAKGALSIKAAADLMKKRCGSNYVASFCLSAVSYVAQYCSNVLTKASYKNGLNFWTKLNNNNNYAYMGWYYTFR